MRHTQDRLGSSPYSRTLGLGLIIATVILSGAGASAAEGTGSRVEALFFIESIAVEGLESVSSAILVSESTLVTGREYSEDQLRQAVYRINRLPFVIEARFSLRKGSERGRYELVIVVEETTRFFFGFDGDVGGFDGDPFSQESFTSTIGVRQFLGPGGVLFASVQPSYFSVYAGDEVEAEYGLGYTQYNLFGRPISLNLGLSHDARSQTTGASFGFGVQLPHNQSLRIDWNGYRREFSGTFLPCDEGQTCTTKTTTDTYSLEWRFDTSDDLLFPTRGVLFSSLASYTTNRSETSNVEGFWRQPKTWLVQLSGQQSHSLAEHQVLVVRADLLSTHSRSDLVEGRQTEVRLGATYGIDLMRTAPRRPIRDLRWHSRVEVIHLDASSDIGDTFHSSGRTTGFTLRTGIDFRSRWGIFGLTVSYSDNFSVDDEIGFR